MKKKYNLFLLVVVIFFISLFVKAEDSVATSSAISNIQIIGLSKNEVVVTWDTSFAEKNTFSYKGVDDSESCDYNWVPTSEGQEGVSKTKHKFFFSVNTSKACFKIKDSQGDIESQEVSMSSENKVQISNVVSEPSKNSVKIKWDTNIPTTAVVYAKPYNNSSVYWCDVNTYIGDNQLNTHHEVVISNLAQDTWYSPRIESYSGTDLASTLLNNAAEIKFKTLLEDNLGNQSTDTYSANFQVPSASFDHANDNTAYFWWGVNDSVTPPTYTYTDTGIYYSTNSSCLSGLSLSCATIKRGTYDIAGFGHWKIELSGLAPNTKYYYKTYADGKVSTSVYNFQTLFSAAQLPDLTVKDIFYNSSKGEINVILVNSQKNNIIKNDFMIKITDQNTGISMQRAVFSYFKNDEQLYTVPVDLKCTDSNCSQKYDFSKGNFNFKIEADFYNVIEESNENNNSLTKPLTISNSSFSSISSEINKVESSNNNQSQTSVSSLQIVDAANLLYNNEFSQILTSISEQEDKTKEQTIKNTYLEKLTSGTNVSEKTKSAINNFITYGVDSNTKKLGAGERAAVVYSYKLAFNKLPQTEVELTDTIRIANGRWPSVTNTEAEKKAKEQFVKIYKRVPDMSDPQDNAAITVMTYGLRQKAENRNLNSEKAGIETFKYIFGHTPGSTEGWNIMQAITYSGSAREKDSDNDLLSDEMEKKLGTDPNKADTDGDGFKDGVEVLSGYNPLKK
jgi:hypothetical protein